MRSAMFTRWNPHDFSTNEFGCGDASDSVQRGKIGSGGSSRDEENRARWGEARNGISTSQLLRRIGTTEENPMTGKYLIAAALVSACAVAASAQTTTEYYVVQDSATKK